MKYTDDQPDEEIHGARSGGVLSTGAFVPMELGCISLPAHGCVLPTWKRAKVHSFGIFMGTSSGSHDH